MLYPPSVLDDILEALMNLLSLGPEKPRSRFAKILGCFTLILFLVVLIIWLSKMSW